MFMCNMKWSEICENDRNIELKYWKSNTLSIPSPFILPSGIWRAFSRQVLGPTIVYEGQRQSGAFDSLLKTKKNFYTFNYFVKTQPCLIKHQKHQRYVKSVDVSSFSEIWS